MKSTSKKVNIGVLKNELSKYLRYVQNGSTIVICDRNEPIAEIIPFKSSGTENWLQNLINSGVVRERQRKTNGIEFKGLNRKFDKEKMLATLDEDRSDRF